MTERIERLEAFPVTANPDNWVQTAAGEEALEALWQKIREARAPAVLVGTAGVGKTMLLRVLERRLASTLRVVYLPFAALPADELCTWILGLLGASSGRDPERDLLAASLRLEATGSALVVILDDAASMPVATARRFSALFAEAEGGLRLVLALAEDSHSDQMLSSFQPAVSRVELRTLMNADETARYLRAHLIRSNAPKEIRARFDPTSIRYLHRGSGGVPRVLNGLAGEVVRGNLSVLPRRETAARDEPLGFGSDPFDVTSDPADYVPREASQELLESVETGLQRGARVIAVTGPPGLGKTLLLRVLERRLRGTFRTVRISYTALLPEEFCRWILTLLGEPAALDAEVALLELVGRLGRSRATLVLLLDDAGSIPLPTVRRLVALAGDTDGAMRVVLFAAEDVRTARILEALGADALTLRFSEPMSAEETADYIHARLAHAGAPMALVRRFDSEVVAQLHVESAGIPRELHKLAGEVYHQAESAVATRAPAPDPRETPAVSALQAPPSPSEPSGTVASEPEPIAKPEPVPEPEPAAERPASSSRLVVLGLLVIAILLAAVPLLRGGFPWKFATRGADPVVAPTAGEQPEGVPALPGSGEPGDLIAVNINATPWASVEVDGEYLGVTPLAGVLLPPGLHVFRARMADGEIREHRVEVGATMRHVVFYAELSPDEIEPELAAEPAPPPPIPEALPEIAVAPSEPARGEPPKIAAVPERMVSAPEPAPPPPAPEPVVAAPPIPSSVEKPLEVAVESSPPLGEEAPEAAAVPAPPPPVPKKLPETAVAPSEPPREEPPKIAAVPERVAPAPEPPSRAPEPAVPPAPASATEPLEVAVEPSQPREAEAPELAAAPLPPPPVPEKLPEIAVEPPQPPREETPEIAVAPEQVASAREPEPAPPPAAPEPISVSINATPWATIEIDGEEIGITPMAGVMLAPGDHEFRVRLPDGTVLEEIVRIAPDNRHIAFAR